MRLDELEELACRKLPPPVSEYFRQGGADQAGGTAGVTGMLAELGADLAHVMTLAGARDVTEVTPDLIA